MPVTPDAETTTKVLYVRIPATLERELEAAAKRDHNNVSATARRLLAAGLRSEQEGTRG